MVGTDLYVTGGFFDAGGDPDADMIARWDGSSWHAVADPLPYWVYTTAVDGTDIYAGGSFENAGGNQFADRIARWDGDSWQPLGIGLEYPAFDILVDGRMFMSVGHSIMPAAIPWRTGLPVGMVPPGRHWILV